MDQHTYSFPKVSPADPHELRETLRATRREATEGNRPDAPERSGDRRRPNRPER